MAVKLHHFMLVGINNANMSNAASRGLKSVLKHFDPTIWFPQAPTKKNKSCNVPTEVRSEHVQLIKTVDDNHLLSHNFVLFLIRNEF